jgi:hypothetical protein
MRFGPERNYEQSIPGRSMARTGGPGLKRPTGRATGDPDRARLRVDDALPIGSFNRWLAPIVDGGGGDAVL